MDLSNITEIPNWEYGKRNPYHSPGLYFQKAQLLTKIPTVSYKERKEIGHWIIEMGETYLSYLKTYYITLKDSISNNQISIKMLNRFHEEYIEKIRNQLYNLHWRHAPNFFLTMTIDYQEFDSIYEGSRALGQEWNRFLTLLKKHDPKLQFIKSEEIQTKNTMNLHLHILISTKLTQKELEYYMTFIKIGTQEKLKNLTDYYYSKHGILPSNRELYYMAIKYILKYITKGMEYMSFKAKLNKFILWALRARTFSYSHSLNLLSGKYTSLDFASKSNSNAIRSYHLKKFYKGMMINFKSHMFYEIQQSRYEFIKISTNPDT